MTSRIFFIYLAIGLFLGGCAYDNEEDLFGEESCIPGQVSFSADIEPIIQANCAISGCHNGSNASIPNWTIFSNIQDKATLIKIRTANNTMPPSNTGITLTSSEISDISCWVDDGALNN